MPQLSVEAAHVEDKKNPSIIVKAFMKKFIPSACIHFIDDLAR